MRNQPLAVAFDVVNISSDEEGGVRLLTGAAACQDSIALELLYFTDSIQQLLGVQPQFRAPDSQPVPDVIETNAGFLSAVATERP